MTISINGTTGINFGDGTTQATAGLMAFRNRVINGAMVVNQRGATSMTADGAYIHDRWMGSVASTLTANFGINTTGTNNPSSTQTSNCLNMFCGATPKTTLVAGDYGGMTQRIEGYMVADAYWGTIQAKPVTVSFAAYASQATTLPVSIRNNATNRSYVTTVNLQAGKGVYSVTIPGDTTGTWDTGANTGISLGFWPVAGSTYQAPSLNSWNAGSYISHSSCSNICDTANRSVVITDVQLEIGSTATAFERRPVGLEILLCQRYYEAGDFYSAAYGGGGFVSLATVPFRCHKRTAPTCAVGGTAYSNSSGAAINSSTVDKVLLTWTTTTTGRSDVSIGWTASAEL